MNKKLVHRLATVNDVPLLAKMNRLLTEDEEHRNRFRIVEWFQKRMESFLLGDYQAVLFEQDEKVIAYALYKGRTEHEDTIYLRQLFVDRQHRRQGIGRQVMEILMNEYWSKDKRLTVEVLNHNKAAFEFYKSVGYKVYCLEMEIKARERN
jgi:ribosomal protein S18 acetylase RimI-like enzyme